MINKQTNDSAHATHFVHFFVITAWDRTEMASYKEHVNTQTQIFLINLR